MSDAIQLTKEEIEILESARGLRGNHSRLSFRNRFDTCPNCQDFKLCKRLEERGLLRLNRHNEGILTYFVTPLGDDCLAPFSDLAT
jgi:hypothetical protein